MAYGMAYSLWPKAYSLARTEYKRVFASVYHLFSEKFLRLSKLFNVGLNRNVSAKKQNGELNITIAETGSEFKTATFPAKRW